MTYRADWENAPRDGTPIEIQCNYGIRPWWGVFRWVDGEWQDANDPQRGLISEHKCTWRHYKGNPRLYRAPAMQYDGAYWGGAPGDMRSPEEIARERDRIDAARRTREGAPDDQ